MGKITAIVGIAALAGIGYYVGKKVIEKRNAEEEERAQHIFEDDSEVFVEEKHSTPKEKLQRASMFAVGAIKTGTEKFKEGIDDIINKDMVSLGEETYAKTKEAAMEKKDKAVAFAKNTLYASRFDTRVTYFLLIYFQHLLFPLLPKIRI